MGDPWRGSRGWPALAPNVGRLCVGSAQQPNAPVEYIFIFLKYDLIWAIWPTLGALVRHFEPISKKQTILMLKLGCHGRHISCTSRFWLRPNKTNPNCSGRKIKCNGSRIKVSKNDKNVDMQLCI